jgi:hypothetical protein
MERPGGTRPPHAFLHVRRLDERKQRVVSMCTVDGPCEFSTLQKSVRSLGCCCGWVVSGQPMWGAFFCLSHRLVAGRGLRSSTLSLSTTAIDRSYGTTRAATLAEDER